MSAIGGVALLCGGIATFMLIASTAIALGVSLPPAIVAGQLAMVAVAVTAIIRARGTWPAGAVPTVLGFAVPRARHLVAGALVGCSTWVLTSLLANALLPHTPNADRDVTSLSAAVTEPSLVVSLFALALVPAICEEIMFRGLLARGLATRLGPVLAVAISAALFAGYHLKPVQLLPTFLFGLALATLAIRARSIVPSILAHLLNNTCVILASRPTSFAAPLASHPVAVAIGAGLFTATGLAIVALSPRQEHPRE